MSEELEVLKIVTQRLDETGLPYMISGSIAANYYTIPRMTRDIDIVIELKEADIEKFTVLFQGDFYVDKGMIETEVLRKGIFNLIHNQYVLKVDFILRKDTKFARAAFSRRKRILVESNPLWIISAEDLILSKLLWAKDSHSEMQIKDVRNLLTTVKDIDHGYIKRWVAALDLSGFYKEVDNE